MRIEVVGKHMDITDGIRAHAQAKVGKLTRYYDHVQQITVRVQAGKKGEFEAEIVVDVEHHDDFVARETATDLYAAIDLATDKAARQLTDFKEKLKQGKR
ncbi:MAG: ribosome-associated translation inhibitor RaiA [Phycisphaerae bacterium]|nr:ribosome-associated translation inhibitor RaiA [Phycisphaerae bacterium]